MKMLIASDIHGSAYYCRKVIEAAEKEGAERILLLGDLLYHGPRNPLPKEYDTFKVTALLNGIKEKLICVRGNCDSEVDQMVLEFPMMAEQCVIPLGTRVLFATHGHQLNRENPPMLQPGDILLNGHFHVAACEQADHFIYMNPGSAALPKDGSYHGYLFLDDTGFVWKDFDGKIHGTYPL